MGMTDPELVTIRTRLAEVDASLDRPGLTQSDWIRLTNEKYRLVEQETTFARVVKFGPEGHLTVAVPNYACKADAQTKGLPLCPSVRRDRTGTITTEHGRQIRVCDDGRKTTLSGSAIVDSKEQRTLHKKRWGMEEG